METQEVDPFSGAKSVIHREIEFSTEFSTKGKNKAQLSTKIPVFHRGFHSLFEFSTEFSTERLKNGKEGRTIRNQQDS